MDEASGPESSSSRKRPINALLDGTEDGGDRAASDELIESGAIDSLHDDGGEVEEDNGDSAMGKKPKGKKGKNKFNPFPFAYHEELILEIEDLTNLGLGIARAPLSDGSKWVVMVPLVLPGESVRAKIFKNNKNFSEADLLEVVRPSKDRVKPECEYFERCGGCQYQHISVPAQRAWKKSQVETLMTKIAGETNASVNDVVGTVDHTYSYRSKLTPHYNVPREVQDLKIGFQQRGSRIMVDIEDCIIATPAINEKYKETRDRIKREMSVKLPKKGATLLFRECEEGVETDFRNMITQRVGDLLFSFKAGEFFQNNPFVLPLMVDHVVTHARGEPPTSSGSSSDSPITHLIDAYCGSGLFALSAAKHFSLVAGVEVSELAVKAASANAKQNGIVNTSFYCGVSEKIFDKVGHFPPEQTVIVLDPPRKGCDQSFLDQLALFAPKRIVYVSCDPATQARDCKIITSNGKGYRITDITPFDLFPQTRHIENVITFVRD